MKKRLLATLAMSALCLTSCGGDDDSDPTPTPTPTPTSSPTPSPTPTPTPTTPASEANLAGLQILGNLPALLNCGGTPVRNAQGQVSGVTDITGSQINSGVFTYADENEFSTRINGEQGPVFDATELTDAFPETLTWISEEPAQLQFVKTERMPAEDVTLGTYVNDNAVCFFGAGLTPSGIPTSGTTTYPAVADGLVSDGSVRRLFLVSTGSVALNADDDEATVTISFRALNDPESKGPFIDLSGRTTSSEITSATATLELSGASLLVGTFTGSNGYTGTVYGSFVGTSGIILPFELSNESGGVIYGVIVADTTLGG